MKVIVIGGDGDDRATRWRTRWRRAARGGARGPQRRRGARGHRIAASLEAMFRAVAPFDAVVCCAGNGAWKPLDQLTEDDFERACTTSSWGR